jgi:hypothetical protein
MKTLDGWRPPRDIAGRRYERVYSSEKGSGIIRQYWLLPLATQAIRTQQQSPSQVFHTLCMHLVVAASFSLCYRAQSQQSPLPSVSEMVVQTPVCDGLIAVKWNCENLSIIIAYAQ